MCATRTQIRLLGRLEISRDGVHKPAAFPGRRSELVFAYLAAEHRRDLSRDELADALWPQRLPDTWAPALRGAVSDVRRALTVAGLEGGELIERTGDGYRFRLPPDAVVDLDDARSSLATARSRASEDPVMAAEAADRAAAIARMPFLPRHEGSWVDGIRRELQEIVVEALEMSARSHLERGDVRAAAAASGRLVETEPLSDAAYRLQIEVLGAAGDSAGALRAYHDGYATLTEELGVEPSAETQAALRRALAGATQEPSRAPPPPDVAVSPLASLSVLVVDDHDFQRRTALTLLGRLGVGTLSEAGDGSEALAQLESSEPPDVIVCDIDMPGMDGVEFIRNIAERRLASAVVIASGLDREMVAAVETVGEGYGLQVLGAIEKPLTARTLSDLLASYQRPRSKRAESEPMSDDDLRDVLASDHLGVSFMPVVDLQLGEVRGATAVPVRTDDHGTPRIASERVDASLAAQLADRVVELACGLAGELGDAWIWIGVARSALASLDHADRLLAITRNHAVEPQRLVCTVAEQAVRRSSPSELDVLTRLRLKGFGICLDGFSGGHASADALSRIPLTAVALAPTLIDGAAADPNRAGALEQVLDSARTLGLPALGRGCDDAPDYELLVQLGCRYAEGDSISGPLPGAEFVTWMRDWQPPGSSEGSR